MILLTAALIGIFSWGARAEDQPPSFDRAQWKQITDLTNTAGSSAGDVVMQSIVCQKMQKFYKEDIQPCTDFPAMDRKARADLGQLAIYMNGLKDSMGLAVLQAVYEKLKGELTMAELGFKGRVSAN